MPERDLAGASQAGYTPWKRTFWGFGITSPKTVFYPVVFYCEMSNHSLAIVIRIKRKAHAFFVHNLPSPSPPFLVKRKLGWKLPFLSKSVIWLCLAVTALSNGRELNLHPPPPPECSHSVTQVCIDAASQLYKEELKPFSPIPKEVKRWFWTVDPEQAESRKRQKYYS